MYLEYDRHYEGIRIEQNMVYALNSQYEREWKANNKIT